MGEAFASFLALTLSRQLRRISCGVGHFMLVAVFSCLSTIFASMALYVAVRDIYGSAIGSLSVSFFYFVLALLGWILSCLARRRMRGYDRVAAAKSAAMAGPVSAECSTLPILRELNEALSILDGIPRSGSMMERMALVAICGLLVGRKLGNR